MSANMITEPTGRPLQRLAEAAWRRNGDAWRLRFEDQVRTGPQLAEQASRCSAGLRRAGLRAGDRVVVCMANCHEVTVTYHAVWRAGAVVTPVLFLLSEDELRHVLADSGATFVVTTPEFLPKVAAAARGVAGVRAIVLAGHGTAPGKPILPFDQLCAGEESGVADGDPAAMAALLYTGGTTGRSKGVVISHDALSAAAWAAVATTHVPGQVRSLSPLPLSHVYGLMISVAALHVPEPPDSVLMRWFDPAGLLRLVQQHRVQTATLVPAMLHALLGQPLEDYDLSSLRRLSSGSAPLPPTVLREFGRRLPHVEIGEGYGCTETAGIISTSPQGETRPGSVGRPAPGVTVRIERLDGTGEAGIGEDGEICVRGPLVMTGYWRAEAETAVALREGWLHTGDVGHRDAEGYLYLVDRIKDVIIRGGFNVYPRDVEEALLRHPDVESCAVVGCPDERLGEEVVAFVALRPGAATTAEDLVGYGKAHLSAAKYPRDVRILPQVPVTSIGKTDRKALRKLLAG